MYTDVTSRLHVRGLALVCIILFFNCVFYDNVPFSGRYPHRFRFYALWFPIGSHRRKIRTDASWPVGIFYSGRHIAKRNRTLSAVSPETDPTWISPGNCCLILSGSVSASPGLFARYNINCFLWFGIFFGPHWAFFLRTLPQWTGSASWRRSSAWVRLWMPVTVSGSVIRNENIWLKL